MGQTTQDGTLYSYDKTAAGLKDLENHVTEQFDKMCIRDREKNNYKIKEKVWKRVDMGNVTLDH